MVVPNEKMNNRVSEVILVDNLNDTEDDGMKEDETTENNEVVILSQSPPSVLTFKPLSRMLRKEVGPLLGVNRFQNLQFENIVVKMRGPAKGIEYIGGDGNCYFRAVSFYLAGNENWHKEIRTIICDYI